MITIPHNLLLLGAGGFIGSHLAERLLSTTDSQVVGVDLCSAKVEHLIGHERFTFLEMDVSDALAVRRLVQKSDAVVSLVALCNPSMYNTIPIDVIEANFNRPYELVRTCAEEKKWLIHFSTSEVYGRTVSSLGVKGRGVSSYELSEDASPLIMGPVHAQRWSYACAKQLLERAIYAYGHEKGLAYTVVRPFNFVGPRMDYIPGIDGEGIPRVLACFIDALMFGKPLCLVDGGHSKRCFTYIDDAIDAMMCILQRPESAKGQVFNIGHPANEVSIAQLADMMIRLYRELRPEARWDAIETRVVPSSEFYGQGYEDSDRRVPDTTKTRELLGWEPKTDLVDALRASMAAYIEHYSTEQVCRAAG